MINMTVELSKPSELAGLVDRTNEIVAKQGFEVYPFRIGCYNASMSTEVFHLPYSPSTLAFLLTSTPDMFELGFIPWLPNENNDDLRDPLDKYMLSVAESIKDTFKDHKLNICHDFEMHFDRRPKVLMQTAGHISGAAYYYQSTDVKEIDMTKDGPLYGVSLHPRYGGWFAFRMIVIFENVQVADNLLEKREPIDILISNEKKKEVLVKFNKNWKDGSYRNVCDVEKCYSERQKEYFSTKPNLRSSLIIKYKKELNNC